MVEERVRPLPGLPSVLPSARRIRDLHYLLLVENSPIIRRPASGVGQVVEIDDYELAAGPQVGHAEVVEMGTLGPLIGGQIQRGRLVIQGEDDSPEVVIRRRIVLELE